MAQVEEKIIQWMQENMEEPPAKERLKCAHPALACYALLSPWRWLRRFLWNGKLLDRASILYELGIETLSTIEMELEPLPKDPNADKDGEGDDNEGDDDDRDGDGGADGEDEEV